MHPNQAFRKTGRDDNLAFARQRGFGTLCLNHVDGPLLSHVPFVLSPEGDYLEAHLVRSNPILKLLKEPARAVIAVSGGDAYVSPDWYGVEDQVPTWNYIAVHLRGRLEKRPAEDLHGVLERLSAHNEGKLLPKPIWTLDKLTEATYRKLSVQIVPIRLTIEDVQGTWKLAQNKPKTAINGAAEGIETAEVGLESNAIVTRMRNL